MAAVFGFLHRPGGDGGENIIERMVNQFGRGIEEGRRRRRGRVGGAVRRSVTAGAERSENIVSGGVGSGTHAGAQSVSEKEEERRRKAEVGRATWTLLHHVAAAMPDTPSRQQQRDCKQLVNLLARVYPCKECADHWGELLKSDPPDTATGPRFQEWLCVAHNSVNRKLNKPIFNCRNVGARWAALDCDSACVLDGAARSR